MDELLTSVAAKKQQLDRLRPVSPRELANLEHYCDIELTFTSNAIEGNTLSAVETTLVIEQGITIGGKPLKDHMEALDHYDAIRYVRELARHQTTLTESDVRNLHRLVVQRSAPGIAGRYADLPRYLRTESGRHSFPSPAEVPALMGDFMGWLAPAPNTPDAAFTAHRRFVVIHPFDDCNGRTARLLMNLILIRGGYPPIAVRPEDRLEYVRGLQQEQAGQGAESFNVLLYRRLDATLGEYLIALREGSEPKTGLLGNMADTRAVIAQVYSAFNRRDLDGALAVMSEDVDWPKASEGGRVVGKEEIRAYWTRQWATFDPHVEPMEVTDNGSGRTQVKVHQLVKSLSGEILSDQTLLHVFTIADGLIERMDIGESEPAFRQDRTTEGKVSPLR